jgi:hypothetical protein
MRVSTPPASTSGGSGDEKACRCSRVGPGVQTFRIRGLRTKFEVVSELGPAEELQIESRAVCRCRSCGRLFALVQVPVKDVEEFLIAVDSSFWKFWDWAAIADAAPSCRWRGPTVDASYVL